MQAIKEGSSIEEKLDSPGAGLPFWELVLLRGVFTVAKRLLSRQTIDRLFLTEQDGVQNLVSSASPNQACQRVLVTRGLGMEDSSRYWSVAMTLEHLNKVNSGVQLIINNLVAGRSVKGNLKIQDVKPSLESDPEVFEQFKAGCLRYRENLKSIPTLKGADSYPHPWFGELDATGWHLLAAIHMGVHRKQIERIINQLKLR